MHWEQHYISKDKRRRRKRPEQKRENDGEVFNEAEDKGNKGPSPWQRVARVTTYIGKADRVLSTK